MSLHTNSAGVQPCMTTYDWKLKRLLHLGVDMIPEQALIVNEQGKGMGHPLFHIQGRKIVVLQVCEEWFNRMRPLLLRLSFATDKHSSTVAYACGLLQTAKAQMKALLAESKAASATKVKLA